MNRPLITLYGGGKGYKELCGGRSREFYDVTTIVTTSYVSEHGVASQKSWGKDNETCMYSLLGLFRNCTYYFKGYHQKLCGGRSRDFYDATTIVTTSDTSKYGGGI